MDLQHRHWGHDYGVGPGWNKPKKLKAKNFRKLKEDMERIVEAHAVLLNELHRNELTAPTRPKRMGQLLMRDVERYLEFVAIAREED